MIYESRLGTVEPLRSTEACTHQDFEDQLKLDTVLLTWALLVYNRFRILRCATCSFIIIVVPMCVAR